MYTVKGSNDTTLKQQGGGSFADDRQTCGKRFAATTHNTRRRLQEQFNPSLKRCEETKQNERTVFIMRYYMKYRAILLF